ncbi:MAG: alpha-ketoacid dehydrogenase subunit beta, partial [Caldilineaceae bacterium]
MRKTTYIQAVNEAMRDEMRRDPSVFLMGEDVGYYGGLFRVTRNLMDEFGPTRVLDTPISEQGFVGMAVGAAMTGMRPIIELMYMDFFMVCADQIFNQAAKMHYMTGGLLKVPMVIRGQHGGGKRYGSQHSQSVESTFAQFPGIKVVAPATPHDAKGLLVSAIRDSNPVLFLEHKMLYFTRGDLPDAEVDYSVPIGVAEVKREGKDLTLATFSYSLLQALEAAEELKTEQGIDVEVVDLRSIVPLDMETVYASVAKTGRLLAVHESQSNCGIGAEMVARI